MDQKRGWMTSGAFAAFCGTTKETLRHYKEIGLLTPAYRGENGYFYYDPEQFYDFYAISLFRMTGTPLEEIRRCLRGQSAQAALEQLRLQRCRLEEERRRLEEMEFMLSSTIRSWELGRTPDLTPRTAWFEKEHLLALPAAELEREIPPDAGEDERLIIVLERCRELCRRYGLQSDYQLGAVHGPGDGEEIPAITYLYTRVKEQGDFPFYLEKPPGYYLYLCCRGQWDISRGYAALIQEIRTRGLRTAGSLYACDLAGFMLNGEEKNSISMISVRLAEPPPEKKMGSDGRLMP